MNDIEKMLEANKYAIMLAQGENDEISMYISEAELDELMPLFALCVNESDMLKNLVLNVASRLLKGNEELKEKFMKAI